VTPVTTPGTVTPVAGQGESPSESPQSGVQGEANSGAGPTSDTGAGNDTAPSATAAPGPTQEAAAGELPFTGVNAWWLALLGFAAAGTGVVLRRRFAPQD
jgi:LPXTG-motif cell wall-anchored protein